MSKTTKHFESWWGKTCLGTGCEEIKLLSTKMYSGHQSMSWWGADLFWHEEEKIQGVFWAPEHVEDDDVEDDKICDKENQTTI